MIPSLVSASIKCPILSRAHKASAEYLVQNSQMRRFDRGESIFLHLTPATHCYVIIHGWVKLYRIRATGDESVLRMHTTGEAFGFGAVTRNEPHPSGADAASDCTLLEIPAFALLHILAEDPDFGRILLGHSYAQNDAMSDQIEALKSLSGIQRMAQFLRAHARDRKGRLCVTLPYEKVLVAAYIGIKPESLSRALAKLRDYGVHPIEGGLEITDPAALDALLGDALERNAG